MVQSTIFDQIEKQKTIGIELVYQHADTTWKREAAQKLMEVINTCATFTSDDVLMPLEKAGIVTKDNRAIASILKSAEKLKLISPYHIRLANGDRLPVFIQCKRPQRHHAPIRVWKSNVLGGKNEQRAV